ncbi:hypothetical protein HDU93_008057 [Gonapodya sp. JEL0774]|nr:hypothetical protein HDU93_008057 [Gonapodya sp. JEL0774]
MACCGGGSSAPDPGPKSPEVTRLVATQPKPVAIEIDTFRPPPAPSKSLASPPLSPSVDVHVSTQPRAMPSFSDPARSPLLPASSPPPTRPATQTPMSPPLTPKLDAHRIDDVELMLQSISAPVKVSGAVIADKATAAAGPPRSQSVVKSPEPRREPEKPTVEEVEMEDRKPVELPPIDIPNEPGRPLDSQGTLRLREILSRVWERSGSLTAAAENLFANTDHAAVVAERLRSATNQLGRTVSSRQTSVTMAEEVKKFARVFHDTCDYVIDLSAKSPLVQFALYKATDKMLSAATTLKYIAHPALRAIEAEAKTADINSWNEFTDILLSDSELMGQQLEALKADLTSITTQSLAIMTYTASPFPRAAVSPAVVDALMHLRWDRVVEKMFTAGSGKIGGEPPRWKELWVSVGKALTKANPYALLPGIEPPEPISGDDIPMPYSSASIPALQARADKLAARGELDGALVDRLSIWALSGMVKKEYDRWNGIIGEIVARRMSAGVEEGEAQVGDLEAWWLSQEMGIDLPIDIPPSSSQGDAHLGRALDRFHAQDYPESLRAAEAAKNAGVSERNSWILTELLAFGYVTSGNPGVGAGFFERLGTPENLMKAAICQAREGDFVKARELAVFAQTIPSAASSGLVLHLRTVLGLVLQLPNTFAGSGADLYEDVQPVFPELVNGAERSWKEEGAEEGHKKFLALVTDNPDDPYLLFRYARCMVATKGWPKTMLTGHPAAMVSLAGAAGSVPSSVPPQAIHAAEEAVSVGEFDAEAFSVLGGLLWKAKDWDRAVEAFDRSSGLLPAWHPLFPIYESTTVEAVARTQLAQVIPGRVVLDLSVPGLEPVGAIADAVRL